MYIPYFLSKKPSVGMVAEFFHFTESINILKYDTYYLYPHLSNQATKQYRRTMRGNLGLLQAADKINPLTTGCTFSSES